MPYQMSPNTISQWKSIPFHSLVVTKDIKFYYIGFKFDDVFCFPWMSSKHAENSGTDLCHLERTRTSERDPSKNTHLRLPGQASCTSCCSYVIPRLRPELGKFGKVTEDCQRGGRGRRATLTDLAGTRFFRNAFYDPCLKIRCSWFPTIPYIWMLSLIILFSYL